jgi:hypothetical protein
MFLSVNMQQSALLILLVFVLGSCGGNSENNTVVTPATEEPETVNLILGEWNMDSSVFINDGVRGTVSAPLLPTTWTFSADGTYKVENSMTMPGTFSNTSDSLFIVLMGVPNDYEILLLNNEKLQLRSTIVETVDMSMKTDAFLTRISE